MECKHLERGKKGDHSNLCNASMSMMVPSIFEMATFCTAKEHSRCPIFQSHTGMECKTEMRQKSISITI